jgi:hypothetical protein
MPIKEQSVMTVLMFNLCPRSFQDAEFDTAIVRLA